MFAYEPPPIVTRPTMGRAVARSLGESVPPPAPDFIMTGYTGVPGYLETLLVLGVLGAAAWAGIRTGMGDSSRALRAAGWIGGVGSAALGVLYLGGRSRLGDRVGLPALRVTPS